MGGCRAEPVDMPHAMKDALPTAPESAAAGVSRGLALLRRVSMSVGTLPAGGRVGEFFRRRNAGRDRELLLRDFDGDAKFLVNLSDHIGGHIFWHGRYAADILDLADGMLRADDTVLDIGANIGEFTVFAARRVPSGEVHAFEPMQALHRQALANCTANGLDNAHVHRLGLGNRAARVPIHVRIAPGYDGAVNHGMNSVHAGDGFEAAETIEVVTLDEWCRRWSPARIDLAKIDVEGAELAVLQGGLETIARFRPKMIVEVNPETCARAGHSSRDLVEFIHGLGYAIRGIGRDGKVFPIADPADASRDVLCLPAETQAGWT